VRDIERVVHRQRVDRARLAQRRGHHRRLGVGAVGRVGVGHRELVEAVVAAGLDQAERRVVLVGADAVVVLVDDAGQEHVVGAGRHQARLAVEVLAHRPVGAGDLRQHAIGVVGEQDEATVGLVDPRDVVEFVVGEDQGAAGVVGDGLQFPGGGVGQGARAVGAVGDREQAAVGVVGLQVAVLAAALVAGELALAI
jgi:hypothetical protein